VFGFVEQGLHGLGDLLFGCGVCAAAASQDLSGVVPRLVAERCWLAARVGSGDGDPAAVVALADPTPGHVVGIVVAEIDQEVGRRYASWEDFIREDVRRYLEHLHATAQK
jgi:hypothetical protein